MLEAPLPQEEALGEELVRGPTSPRGPISRSWLSGWRQPVLFKVSDDVSADEISAAGAQALPFRLNIPKLAEFAFTVMVTAVERKQGMVPSAMLTARW